MVKLVRWLCLLNFIYELTYNYNTLNIM